VRRSELVRGPAIVVMLLLVSGPRRDAHAQFFSPGPLAKPHAALDDKGLGQCGACHDKGEPRFANRCLACHTELGPELKERDGLHGHMTPVVLNQCQNCHPDHRGLGFSLITFGGSVRGFDHKRTGWPLRGHHAQTSCESCHASHQLVDQSVVRMLAAQPGRTTYLGLSRRCDSCHFDEHRGQLGKDCQKCHGDTALFWKTTLGAFDHQQTAFPLRGKHKPVPCAGCHPTVEDPASGKQIFPPPRSRNFTQMKPIAHGTCESCHKDPHKGSFGPSCASCHTEDGWNVILPARDLAPTFHDRTRFPLRGAHATVACKSCHGPFGHQAALFRGLAFGKCSDCHQDAHVGQLAALPGRPAGDGAACHDETAFMPPRYELETHAKTRFPLEGGHASAACRDCHPFDKSLTARVPDQVTAKLAKQHRPVVVSLAVLRPKIGAQTCSRCHKDPHEGQFEAEIKTEDCGGCHTVKSFADLTPFNHDHDSRFPLSGAHRTAPCAACHRLEQIRAGEAPVVRWKPLPTTCGGCHRDEHQGQFLASTLPSDGVVRDSEGCDFCHSTTTFKTTGFRHDQARFTTYALQGKHGKLGCGDCHRSVTLTGQGTSRTIQTVRYRPLPRACEGCHVDFHHGDFKGFEP
jgi:hypothetical protein